MVLKMEITVLPIVKTHQWLRRIITINGLKKADNKKAFSINGILNNTMVIALFHGESNLSGMGNALSTFWILS